MMYSWDIPSLSGARITNRKKINYNQVKTVIDSIKVLIKKEGDPSVRRDLCEAGMALNRILLK